MISSPLSQNRFRWIFFICLAAIALIQTQVLCWFGFSLEAALLDGIVSSCLLGVACVAVSYGMRFYLPGEYEILYFLFRCAVLSMLWLLAFHWVMHLLSHDTVYLNFLWDSYPYRFVISFLLIGWMALITVLHTQQQRRSEEAHRKADAEKLNREAELFKLRQQLQPHFLFNSLNSIIALIGSHPDEARNMTQKLSEFLRGSIRREDQWMELEEEIHHLNLYLEIEKVRFGHRLQTQIVCEPGSEKKKIPALLLQPVVENAIKFGLYDTTGDVLIRIDAGFANNELTITVQNPFDPSTAASNRGTGFGLNAVKRRLYLLFGRNDLVQNTAQENIFTTIIKIPQAIAA